MSYPHSRVRRLCSEKFCSKAKRDSFRFRWKWTKNVIFFTLFCCQFHFRFLFSQFAANRKKQNNVFLLRIFPFCFKAKKITTFFASNFHVWLLCEILPNKFFCFKSSRFTSKRKHNKDFRFKSSLFLLSEKITKFLLPLSFLNFSYVLVSFASGSLRFQCFTYRIDAN
jgi:hypothetical protein